MYLSGTAEFMVPVCLEENLGSAAFVSGPESGPADSAAYILFIDGYTIFHGPRCPAQPAESTLYLGFDEPAMAQLLFVSVFCPNGKARIIAVTADAIMGNQFVGQPVQTQGQIEIGSVFADPRIIPSQSVTVRIAAAAKIRRLAFRIAKADSLSCVSLWPASWS